jgi:hypothetical protein
MRLLRHGIADSDDIGAPYQCPATAEFFPTRAPIME